MKNFLPTNFTVPKEFETKKIRLRMLTINDLVKDYDAVMTSLKHLQETQPFGPHNPWPQNSLTLEQDLIDLGWHQKEFQLKRSFAFTVMNPEETICLGCVYVFPSPNSTYDAKIILWARQSEIKHGLDEHLFSSVSKWIKQDWPFKNPGYPGRTIDWKTWLSLN